ncbi:MAG: prepilin-type N-terminal cleavage/methylation domain-containing protein [Proteobacteria bacterium]|nr:prepilin-type N-terminal cleavage/methylation domain-containing protein [Pseudomonadota bacterium]
MRRGFSLFELIICTFVVSIVVIVLINLYPMSLYTMRRGDRMLVADQIAQNVLERARSGSFDFLWSKRGVGYDDDGHGEEHDGITYHWACEVNDVADIPEAEKSVLEVLVTVQWKERNDEVKLVKHGLYVLNVPQ